MNNEVATKVRNIGIDYIFNNVIDINSLIRKDSGKFIFKVNDGTNDYYCEIDFVCKKEDYTPDYDIRKYAEKVQNQELKKKEKEENKKKKVQKKNNDIEE